MTGRGRTTPAEAELEQAIRRVNRVVTTACAARGLHLADAESMFGPSRVMLYHYAPDVRFIVPADSLWTELLSSDAVEVERVVGPIGVRIYRYALPMTAQERDGVFVRRDTPIVLPRAGGDTLVRRWRNVAALSLRGLSYTQIR